MEFGQGRPLVSHIDPVGSVTCLWIEFKDNIKHLQKSTKTSKSARFPFLEFTMGGISQLVQGLPCEDL